MLCFVQNSVGQGNGQGTTADAADRRGMHHVVITLHRDEVCVPLAKSAAKPEEAWFVGDRSIDAGNNQELNDRANHDCRRIAHVYLKRNRAAPAQGPGSRVSTPTWTGVLFMPAPIPLAMIVCDGCYKDPFTNKHTLIGTFSALAGSSFPISHPHVVVYLALTNGHGRPD